MRRLLNADVPANTHAHISDNFVAGVIVYRRAADWKTHIFHLIVYHSWSYTTVNICITQQKIKYTFGHSYAHAHQWKNKKYTPHLGVIGFVFCCLCSKIFRAGQPAAVVGMCVVRALGTFCSLILFVFFDSIRNRPRRFIESIDSVMVNVFTACTTPMTEQTNK